MNLKKELKKDLKRAGLALGVTEALLLAGCVEQNDPSWAANASEREAAAELAPRVAYPLRIDRAFFEGSVTADLAVSAADGGRLSELRSQVAFSEGQPVGEAPKGDYIADFRDRPGYARLVDSEGVSLNFVVAPDVASLDVTAAKVTLEGVEPLIEQRLRESPVEGCAPSVEKIEFAEASKTDDGGLVVRFRAQAAPAEQGSACAPLNVEVRLAK